MSYRVALRKIEIIVSLYTTAMSVCRHCVPNRTWSKLGKSHLQLARSSLTTVLLRKHVVNDELVDDAVVAFLHLSGVETV